MGTKRSLPQLCLEREHNFNYRSWPHCLGNVVGARARGKKPSSLSAKFSARVSGTKAFARSQPRKEDQGRGEGISNPLLSSRLASPRLASLAPSLSPFAYWRAEEWGWQSWLGCLPTKNYIVHSTLATRYIRERVEKEGFVRKRNGESFTRDSFSLGNLAKSERGQKDRYR